jgi:short-subunit dehydrogenase
MPESPPGVALVTGASSGLGEEFARQLSASGHDLVLVARRADRLEQLASELPTAAHIVSCDLASEADTLRDRVAELGVEVDLLVNNAGFGTHGPFIEQNAAREAEEVRLNCEAIVTLTHAFLPDMVARGRGGVIVVASGAAMQPIPYQAVYAATKAFALSLTDALHTELRGTGVRVLAVNPGPVPTEWQEVAGVGKVTSIPGTIEADQCVREALDAYERGDRSIVPGTFFRWFLRASAPVPRSIQLRVTERLYRGRGGSSSPTSPP